MTVERDSEYLLEKEVVGTTLRVYLHLLKVRHASAREVYRYLEMSTPSLAAYHLDKLNRLQLVNKDSNGAYNVKSKGFGILRFFIITRRWIIPRTFFYSLLYLAMAISLLFLLPPSYSTIGFVLMLVPTLTNVIEALLFYRTMSDHTKPTPHPAKQES